jgi:tellurite methyltransferase
MGNGRNAIYLAKMGFEVEGVDISLEAVEEALERAQEEGVSIKTRVEDLEKIPYIEEETYDLVICFNYLQRSLMPQIKNWVKFGGMLVYETFIIDQVQFGKPQNPDYLLRHNELLHTFRDFRVLRYREGIVEGRRAVASILAQKEG